jgi:vanillate monooxygenase ferredoxin subunit
VDPRRVSDPATILDVIISRRETLADGIIGLELVAADSTPFPAFDAGAHVDVYVSPGVVRQYSICNDPTERTRYRLGILQEANSRGGSTEIHRTFIEGRRIKIGTPRNNFRLVDGAREVVLLAGGIGITPLLSMALHLKRRATPFHLCYCTRTRSRTAFLAELGGDLAAHTTVHFDDGPDAQRFSPEKMALAPNPGTHAYVCGPQGFMDWVIGELKRLGWTHDNIHVEYFTAVADKSGDVFRVIAARSGKTVEVPAGKTIAEVLIAHGIEVPMSCEQGVCGTCLTKVLNGIPDHRDMYQTDAEKAANQHMTPCCSRALSPTIELDI